MDEREKQLRRYEEALEEKSEAVRAQASERKLDERDRPQDVASPRAKNAGKGKKTADKWNQ